MSYTLELFRLFLERDPIGLPPQIKAQGEAEYKRLEQQEAMPEQIEAFMVKYGLEVWPYMQADFEFYNRYGKEKEEVLMMRKFSPELKAKWDAFVAEGGSMHDYHNGDKFERYFTAEENIAIEEALIQARNEVREELNTLTLNEKRDEYDGLIVEYKNEEQAILQKLEELEVLKKAGDKWDAEIDEFIYYVRKGFAELEERPSVKKVQETIDLYQGQIEAGNK